MNHDGPGVRTKPDRDVADRPAAPLCPYAKIHSTDQDTTIAASMAKFGWTVPCMVADDGELIAGHGRILAAGHLGLIGIPEDELDALLADADDPRLFPTMLPTRSPNRHPIPSPSPAMCGRLPSTGFAAAMRPTQLLWPG